MPSQHTILITSVLGNSLQTRLEINELLSSIRQLDASNITIDFTNVKFATRCFIDEYYNVIHKQSLTHIRTINIPKNIRRTFKVVISTQHSTKSDINFENTIQCSSLEDIITVFHKLSL